MNLPVAFVMSININFVNSLSTIRSVSRWILSMKVDNVTFYCSYQSLRSYVFNLLWIWIIRMSFFWENIIFGNWIAYMRVCHSHFCLISYVNFSLKIASCNCVNFSHEHDCGFEFIDHFSKARANARLRWKHCPVYCRFCFSQDFGILRLCLLQTGPYCFSYHRQF